MISIVSLLKVTVKCLNTYINVHMIHLLTFKLTNEF